VETSFSDGLPLFERRCFLPLFGPRQDPWQFSLTDGFKVKTNHRLDNLGLSFKAKILFHKVLEGQRDCCKQIKIKGGGEEWSLNVICQLHCTALCISSQLATSQDVSAEGRNLKLSVSITGQNVELFWLLPGR